MKNWIGPIIAAVLILVSVGVSIWIIVGASNYSAKQEEIRQNFEDSHGKILSLSPVLWVWEGEEGTKRVTIFIEGREYELQLKEEARTDEDN